MNGPAVHELGTPHWLNLATPRYWVRVAGAGLVLAFATWIVWPPGTVPAFALAAGATGYALLTHAVLTCPFCHGRVRAGASVCPECSSQVTTP